MRKCSTGMAKVFLADMEKEREKMKMQLHKMIDPRSAARTPAANRLPHYKLRYILFHRCNVQSISEDNLLENKYYIVTYVFR